MTNAAATCTHARCACVRSRAAAAGWLCVLLLAAVAPRPARSFGAVTDFVNTVVNQAPKLVKAATSDDRCSPNSLVEKCQSSIEDVANNKMQLWGFCKSPCHAFLTSCDGVNDATKAVVDVLLGATKECDKCDAMQIASNCGSGLTDLLANYTTTTSGLQFKGGLAADPAMCAYWKQQRASSMSYMTPSQFDVYYGSIVDDNCEPDATRQLVSSLSTHNADGARMAALKFLCSPNSTCLAYLRDNKCSERGISALSLAQRRQLQAGGYGVPAAAPPALDQLSHAVLLAPLMLVMAPALAVFGKDLGGMADTAHDICNDPGQVCSLQDLLGKCPDSMIMSFKPNDWTAATQTSTCSGTCKTFLSAHNFCAGSDYTLGVDLKQACHEVDIGGCTAVGLDTACNRVLIGVAAAALKDGSTYRDLAGGVLDGAQSCTKCQKYIADHDCHAVAKMGTTPGGYLNVNVELVKQRCKLGGKKTKKDPPCKDSANSGVMNQSCPQVKKFCNDPMFKATFAKTCPKTCGLCGTPLCVDDDAALRATMGGIAGAWTCASLIPLHPEMCAGGAATSCCASCAASAPAAPGRN